MHGQKDRNKDISSRDDKKGQEGEGANRKIQKQSLMVMVSDGW